MDDHESRYIFQTTLKVVGKFVALRAPVAWDFVQEVEMFVFVEVVVVGFVGGLILDVEDEGSLR